MINGIYPAIKNSARKLSDTLYLGVLILLAVSTKVSGQCPPWQLSIPDTVCQNSPTLLSASSSQTGFTGRWDFNAGDSKNQAYRFLSGNFPILSQGTAGMDLEVDNGILYGFTVRPFSLTRIEFPSDTTQPPIVTDLGGLGIITGGAVGINILKDNNQFYGLINLNSGDLIRLEFGTSLSNTPTATAITLPPGLANSPFYMDVARMNQDIVAVIPNWSGQSVTIVNFGSSITNTPTAYNINLPGSNPVSVSIVNECGNLSVFVAYFSADPITRISFGNAVSSTQYTTTSINLTNSNFYREITVLNVGLEWILFATSGGGNVIDAYRLGPNLSNTNPSRSVFIIGNPNDFYFSDFHVYDSKFVGYGLNTATGDLNRVGLPESLSANPGFSFQLSDSVVFQNEGTYYISFAATNNAGSTQWIYDTIVVIKNPMAGFTSTTGCLNTPVFFLNTSSQDAITFQWNFGDGNTSNSQSPSNLYQQAGTFPVTLQAGNTFGCTSSRLDTVIVYQQPIAAFTFSNFACAGTPLDLNDNSTTASGTINNWTWIIGTSDTLLGSQPAFSFNQDGIYEIKLIVGASTGCFDTSAALCTVLPGPIAGFEVTNTCLGDSVRFINNTFTSGGLNTDYLWRFTPNDSSALEEPVFQFPTSSAGNYIISMTASSSNGCTDTVSTILHIGPPAIADFGIDNDTVCTASPVNFSDSSLVSPTETILERIWDFGDGQQSVDLQSTTHSYSNPGTYTVTLSVKTATNCISSATKPITVIESPSVGFSTQSVCEDINIVFLDTSSSSSSTQITQWNWTFDTLGVSTSQSPSFLFSEPGTYSIGLEVIDNNGCSSEVNIPLAIQPRPSASFTVSNSCTNSFTSFTNTSQITNGSISSWQWNFGDGSTGSTSQNPAHTYLAPGAYPVQLISMSSFGCPDTSTLILVVDPSPEFTLQPSQACYGAENSFGFSFVNTPVTNPSFIWDFGDSTFSLQASPSHLYGSPGSRTVLLTITDLDNGCIRIDSLTAIVNENPSADFQPQDICKNDTLILQDQSTGLPNDSIVTWEWSSLAFPNLVGQAQAIPGIATGTYPVQLSVTSVFGCKDSITKNITVHELPTVQFTATPYFGAPPLIVQFTNLSDQGQSLWDFKDGSAPSPARSPIHIFQDTGSYFVNLTLTDTRGCVDSTQTQIIVLQPFLDLAVNQIEFNETDESYTVETRLRNNGNTSVTSFKIRLELNSKSPVIENVENVEIQPGQAYNHPSAISFVKDRANPEFICVELLEVNGIKDEVPTNDKKCLVFTDEFRIFDLYPNPVFDQLNIPIYTKEQGKVELELYDIQGRKVIDGKSTFVPKGLTEIHLDTQSLTAGTYVLLINFGSDQYTFRLTKTGRP